jgi:hypothetical protein
VAAPSAGTSQTPCRTPRPCRWPSPPDGRLASEAWCDAQGCGMWITIQSHYVDACHRRTLQCPGLSSLGRADVVWRPLVPAVALVVVGEQKQPVLTRGSVDVHGAGPLHDELQGPPPGIGRHEPRATGDATQCPTQVRHRNTDTDGRWSRISTTMSSSFRCCRDIVVASSVPPLAPWSIVCIVFFADWFWLETYDTLMII